MMRERGLERVSRASRGRTKIFYFYLIFFIVFKIKSQFYSTSVNFLPTAPILTTCTTVVFKDESSHQSYFPCRPRCDPARNPNRCGWSDGTEGTEGNKGTEGAFGKKDKGTEGAFGEGDKGTKSGEIVKGAEADLTTRRTWMLGST